MPSEQGKEIAKRIQRCMSDKDKVFIDVRVCKTCGAEAPVGSKSLVHFDFCTRLAEGEEFDEKELDEIMREHHLTWDARKAIKAYIHQQIALVERREREGIIEELINQLETFRGLWLSNELRPDGTLEVGWAVTFVLNADMVETCYFDTPQKTLLAAIELKKKLEK